MGRWSKRGRRRLSGDLDHRRQGNADRLKEGTGASGSGGAEAKPFAGLIDVADDIAPFESTAGSGKTIDQFLAQKEGKKRAEHMSADRLISPMKDRARIDNGFRRSEDVLHDPSLAISKRDRERRESGIGANDIEAVELGGGGNTLGVDGEVAFTLGLDETAETSVADDGLVTLPQGLVQSGEDRFAGGGVVAGFRLVVADDIAAMPRAAGLTLLDLANHLLDLKIEGASAIGFGNCQRYERSFVGQNGGDLDVPLFPHAQNRS